VTDRAVDRYEFVYYIGVSDPERKSLNTRANIESQPLCEVILVV